MAPNPAPLITVEVLEGPETDLPPAFAAAVLARAATVAEIAARLPGPCEVTVRITDDEDLRTLNRRFLGEDHVTDILSFPASGPGEKPVFGAPAGPSYLGDIAISWLAVERQASEFGCGTTQEMGLLLVHGLLHLLGWDHADKVAEAEMTRLTRRALAAAGIEIAPGRL